MESMQHTDLQRQPAPRLVDRIALIVIAVLFSVMAGDLALKTYFEGRVYPGVSVAAIDLSGRERATAAAILRAKAEDFNLSLAVGNKVFKTDSRTLGVKYDISASVEEAYQAGRGHLFAIQDLLAANSSRPSSFAYLMDQTKLNNFIDHVTESVGVAPIDAGIEINQGNITVSDPRPGVALDGQLVARALSSALGEAVPTTLKIKPKVIQAALQPPDLQPAIASARKLMALSVTLNYQGKQFIPDAAEIGSWLDFNKQSLAGNLDQTQESIEVVVDPAKLKGYIQAIANSIDIAPVTKKVNVQNGVSSVTQEGQDGVAVNQDALVSSITIAMTGGQNLVMDVPTAPVPFKTQYNQTISLDYGRYVEINLTTQTLFVYQDHQLIYTSPVASGASYYGFATPTGLFSIYYKSTNTHLRGYQYGWDYDVVVQYWMPFNGGVGMHDSSWRSDYGQADYIYNGSHGCVNLPFATAQWLYGWADIGTPVWVHY